MFFESFLLNLAVIVVLIFALIFDYVTKFFSYWYVRHIAYKHPVPFFGSDYHRVLGLRSATDEINTLCHQHKTEKLVGCIKSRIPELVIKDPEIIKLMLSKESENFNSRGLCLDRSQDVCLRNNLFYAEGEKWDLLRGHLESILKSMTRKFEQNESSINKYLDEVNGEINVQNFLEIIIDRVIKDLLFEEDLNGEGKAVVSKLRSEFLNVTIINKLKSYLKNIFPSVYTIFGFSTLNSNLCQEMGDVIKKSVLFETKGFNLGHFYTNKIKSKAQDEKLGTETAFSIISSFISEGYIPCMNTLCCLMYELSKDREMQSKARKSEQYLNYCIKETLRLYPSYPFVTRKCIKRFKFPESDLLIDRGVTITVPIDSIHKDSQHYENATEFNPDRFSEEHFNKITECSYLPYGIGHRKCIGEELSQVVMNKIAQEVLRKYRIECSAKSPKQLTFKDYNFSRILNETVWLKFIPLNVNK